MAKRDSFPGYPHLKRRAYVPRYGWLTLVDVQRTSDGFLIGTARTDDGELVSNLFIGAAPQE